MQKVFVSYSHGDSNFADKLVSDLYLSEIEATYDKWILNVGDSIIFRLSEELADAASVVALLSPKSVKSAWVRKELALAMTGEISSGSVKVLPALIEDCVLPDMLADKLYADFRGDYYRGLHALLQALRPEWEGRNRHADARLHRRQELEISRQELIRLLQAGDEEAVHDWLHGNRFVLAGLFSPWSSFDIIPRLAAGDIVPDFTVVNGQSGRYDASLVFLNALHVGNEEALRRANALPLEALRWCRDNSDTVRRELAVRMTSAYGAEQIFPGTSSALAMRTHIAFDAKVIMGRRVEYGFIENEIRNQLYQDNNRDVDVISYDRITEALGHLAGGLRESLSSQDLFELVPSATNSNCCTTGLQTYQRGRGRWDTTNGGYLR